MGNRKGNQHKRTRNDLYEIRTVINKVFLKKEFKRGSIMKRLTRKLPKQAVTNRLSWLVKSGFLNRDGEKSAALYKIVEERKRYFTDLTTVEEDFLDPSDKNLKTVEAEIVEDELLPVPVEERTVTTNGDLGGLLNDPQIRKTIKRIHYVTTTIEFKG